MSKKTSARRKISFDSEYYEFIFAYLDSQSLLRNSILIPIKARPFTFRTTPKMLFRCNLDKGQTVSTLSWKSYYSPLETIAVCFLLLICVAAWIEAIIRKTIKSFSTISILFFASFISLIVVLYYYSLYWYCNKRFIEIITTKIAKADLVNQSANKISNQSGDGCAPVRRLEYSGEDYPAR